MQASQQWRDALQRVRSRHQTETMTAKTQLAEQRAVLNQRESELEQHKLEFQRQLQDLRRSFEARERELQALVQTAKETFEAQEETQLSVRERLQAEVDELLHHLLADQRATFEARPATVIRYRVEEARRLELAAQHPELKEQLGQYSQLKRRVQSQADAMKIIRDDLDEPQLLQLARLVWLKPEEADMMLAIESAGLNEEMQLPDGELVLPIAFHQGTVQTTRTGQGIREFYLALPVPEEALDSPEQDLPQVLALTVASALVDLQQLYGELDLPLEADQFGPLLVYRAQLQTTDTDHEICSYLEETLQDVFAQQPQLQEFEISCALISEFAPTLLRHLASWDAMEETGTPDSVEAVYA